MKRSHCVIESWMIDFFNIKGDKLIIYSIIYGFSQDGHSMYMGSREYLSKWCGCSVKNVQRILNGLVEDKLILRYKVAGQKTRGYKANLDKINECIKDDEKHKKSFGNQIDDNNFTIDFLR